MHAITDVTWFVCESNQFSSSVNSPVPQPAGAMTALPSLRYKLNLVLAQVQGRTHSASCFARRSETTNRKAAGDARTQGRPARCPAFSCRIASCNHQVTLRGSTECALGSTYISFGIPQAAALLRQHCHWHWERGARPHSALPLERNPLKQKQQDVSRGYQRALHCPRLRRGSRAAAPHARAKQQRASHGSTTQVHGGHAFRQQADGAAEARYAGEAASPERAQRMPPPVQHPAMPPQR